MEIFELISMAISDVTKQFIKKFIGDNTVNELICKKLGNAINEDNVKKTLKEYIDKCFENNIFMNTIAFKNNRMILHDLYIPLTITRKKYDDTNNKESYIINESELKFINTYQKVLIVDNAGMGKSTLIKYLLIKVISEKLGIPVIIELRNLNKNIDILEYIRNQIPLINKELNIEDLISKGGWIFLFDGYDEVIETDKEGVTKMLKEFIEKTNNNNNFVLSSREDSALCAFGDFMKFNIEPLKNDEAFELIKKYDNYGKISERLIKELQNNDTLKTIKEFLSNPLMVSLLYMAYRHIPTIPYEKSEFYNQVYNALFEEHDFTKEAFERKKKSGLSKTNFKIILSAIGFLSIQQSKIIFLETEFLNLVKTAINNMGINIKVEAEQILNDVINAVPFFIKENSNIRWVHKSFSEYFAANFIAFNIPESKREEIVNGMLYSENNLQYINILDFYYDLDKIGAKKISYKLICDYIKYYDNSYNSEIFKIYRKELINQRKNFCFVLESKIIKNTEFREDIKIKENFEYYKRVTGFKNIFKVGHYIYEYEYKNGNVYIIFSKKPVINIVELIYNKKVDIFNKSYDFNSINHTTNGFRNLKDNIYTVDDDCNSDVNKNEFFIEVAKVINEHTRLFIDYGKCIELKEEFEKEESLREQQLNLFKIF